jgi:hypothetical protein
MSFKRPAFVFVLLILMLIVAPTVSLAQSATPPAPTEVATLIAPTSVPPIDEPDAPSVGVLTRTEIIFIAVLFFVALILAAFLPVIVHMFNKAYSGLSPEWQTFFRPNIESAAEWADDWTDELVEDAEASGNDLIIALTKHLDEKVEQLKVEILKTVADAMLGESDLPPSDTTHSTSAS